MKTDGTMTIARIILWTLLLFIPNALPAQELILVNMERSDGSIGEQFEVLKKRKSIKNGIYRRFYQDGQVNLHANYLNNILNGPFESMHPNGHSAAAGLYLAGMKQGDWAYSDAQGIVTVKGAFKDDSEEGSWSYNGPDGYRITVNYQAGKLNGPWELRLNEQLLATCSFTDGLPDSGSLKLTTDSVYRYADSLYQIPETNPFFTLLKFSGYKFNGRMPDEPRFVAGIQAVRDYLSDYVRLPRSVFQLCNDSGVPKMTCYVQITVSQFGTIEKVEILRSFSQDLDQVIIRAVKDMPLWIPAMNRKIPVRSVFSIPYSFQAFVIR